MVWDQVIKFDSKYRNFKEAIYDANLAWLALSPSHRTIIKWKNTAEIVFRSSSMYIWVKSCRTVKKCSECPNFTLTQKVTLSKPSIPQTWVFYPFGYLCLGHLHKNFDFPGTIFKGLKFKGKKCQNGQFLIISDIWGFKFWNSSTEVAV